MAFFEGTVRKEKELPVETSEVFLSDMILISPANSPENLSYILHILDDFSPENIIMVDYDDISVFIFPIKFPVAMNNGTGFPGDFTLLSGHNPHGFIQIQSLSYSLIPQGGMCKAAFNSNHYNDSLYTYYHIIMPESIKRAVVKRRAEFLAGRYCCAQLLHHFSLPTHVGQNRDRSPAWPVHVRGAISHCESHAIAVITQDISFSLGADIEMSGFGALAEIRDIITTPAERSAFRSFCNNDDFALLMAFSAKESFYKALRPRVQRIINFDSLSLLSINPQDGSFTLGLTRNISAFYYCGKQFRGYYCRDEKTLTTLVMLSV